ASSWLRESTTRRCSDLGVSNKPNGSDLRDSPAMDVILLLQQKGTEDSYYDPLVHGLGHEGISLQSVELSDEALQSADCVVVVTHHDSFDWQRIADQAALVLDTRNALRHYAGRARVIPL